MRRRRLATVCTGLTAVLVTVACGGDVSPASSVTAPIVEDTAASWRDGNDDVASLTLLSGRYDLDETTDEIRIDLRHARMVRIPDECEPSSVTGAASAIIGADLVCTGLSAVDSVAFTAIVLGQAGDEVGGTITARRGLEYRTDSIPTRTISGGEPTLSPDLRLLSSPDFLNGDVGNLAKGPGFWSQQPEESRTSNSTNRAYKQALNLILNDWESLDPAGVLVAGDLVDGRWGYDDEDSGNFGPVGTTAERRLALQRAARTYYPQWKERFAQRGLSVFPAMGDHEYGDNPWPRAKRKLAANFKAEYARVFTTDASGQPLFTDRPEGPASLTAYAGRPSPDVQVVTLDVFDITPAKARVRVDAQQMKWLRGVLRRAKRDDVEWIIVQAHVPILYPVRTRASSRLHYPRGSDSRLWKVFARFGVDLYLSGEVHDTTTAEADGIVQISHGGIFQFSLTTALLLDFYGDRLYVTLRDYDMQHSEKSDGTRLWETRRNGMPGNLEVSPRVSTIGTATIVGKKRGSGSRLTAPSGILIPPGGAS